MYKKTILAAALLASLPAFAAKFYLVAPLTPINRTNPAESISVSLNAYALPAGVVGRAYTGFDFNSVLQVSGDPSFDAGSVKWTLAGGALPAGLSLSSSGQLVGAPTMAESASFQLMATYKTKSGQQAYQVVVGEVSISLAEATLPAGLQGAAYSYDLKPRLAVSGDPDFTPSSVTWSIASGALPAGLQLNSDGTITGTPAAEGSHPFTVQASYLGKSGERQYQVIVGAIAVSLAAAELPAGVQGAQYSVDLRNKLSITGDAAYSGSGITWSVASGSLPQGLVLSADGVISGVPSAANTGVPFTLRATYKTKSGEQAYAVVVGAITVKLASATLPTGVVGKTYTGFDLKPHLTVAGDAAYPGNSSGVTWAVSSGALPAGLTLNATTGEISGTPTARGAGPVQVKATYKAAEATQNYTFQLSDSIKQFSGYRAWSDGTLATSCLEYRQGKTGYVYEGATGDSIYRIDVDGAGALTPVDVQCDMTTDGGGWTVFQSRVNGSVDFYRNYADYAAGFGSAATEYWLGNNRLAAMTATARQLRIDMQRTNGQAAYAQYSSFKINGAADGHRLIVSGYSGTAGDSLSTHSGYMFSTKDVDRDTVSDANCAVIYSGAWWYHACHASNLNGLYLNGPHASYANGVNWWDFAGHYESLKVSKMKVR